MPLNERFVDHLNGFHIGDFVCVKAKVDPVFNLDTTYRIVELDTTRGLTDPWVMLFGEGLSTFAGDRHGKVDQRRWIQLDYVEIALSENDIEYYRR